ncbi:hypothetical protein [Thalassotalea litorea]
MMTLNHQGLNAGFRRHFFITKWLHTLTYSQMLADEKFSDPFVE